MQIASFVRRVWTTLPLLRFSQESVQQLLQCAVSVLPTPSNGASCASISSTSRVQKVKQTRGNNKAQKPKPKGSGDVSRSFGNVAALDEVVQHYLGKPLVEFKVSGAVMQELLSRPPAQLEMHLEDMVTMFGTPRTSHWLRACPELLACTADAVKQRLVGFADLAEMEYEDAVDLAIREPRLLTMTPDKLEAHLQQLSALISVPMERLVGKLLPSRPSVVLTDMAVLERRVNVLRDLTDYSRSQLSAMLRAEPTLVYMTAAELVARHRRLVDLSEGHPDWRRWWKTSQPAVVGRAMRCTPAALRRMTYLVETAQQGEMPMLLVITSAHTKFMEEFRTFAAWERRNYRRLATDKLLAEPEQRRG